MRIRNSTLLKDGDTSLHVFIRDCKSVAQLQAFIKAHDKAEMQKMAKTVNNKGELPLCMIYSLPLSFDERNKLQALVLPYCLPKKYNPFKAKVDKQEITKRYAHLKGTTTYTNILLAIKAINETRELINETSTHPEVNELDEVARVDRREKIISIRSDYDKVLVKKKIKIDQATTAKELEAMLHDHATYFSDRHAANCDELSRITLDKLHSFNKKIDAAAWSIPNGDHVFVVIDHNSPHAIFCDPLLGDVYTLDDLPAKMKTYYQHWGQSSFVNLLMDFNPAYHYIHGYFSIGKLNLSNSKLLKYTDYKSSEADINRAYKDGLTPLHAAAKEMNVDLVKSLLKRKADANIQGSCGNLPLCDAAALGNEEIVKLLLAANANPNSTTNAGITPLIRAVKSGHVVIVKTLLEHNADPNKTMHSGAAPLHFVKSNSSEIIKVLLDHKANLNSSTFKNSSPLLVSVSDKDLTLAKEFLDAKADPNIKAVSGLTPLYLAAQENQPELVKQLINHGADPRIKFRGLFTPLFIASQKGHQKVVEILEKTTMNLSL